jgi:murein DD-endopeptidase MepM/ murein hydrolase activator NlpD
MLALLSIYMDFDRRGRIESTAIAPAMAAATPVPEVARVTEKVGVFSRNQTFADALAGHGISNSEVYRLVESTRPVYDLAKVRAQRPYWLTLTAEGEVKDFRYPVDDERYLTVYRNGNEYVPVMKKFPYEVRVAPVSCTIENSLFLSVGNCGEEDQLALDLADIFMWDIDFYTDIQNGDSFRILVEKKYLDGKFVKYGSILASEFINVGKTHSAFRFQEEGGSLGYYGADGRSLKKSFLKSPLKFARITSGFSKARLHPILKKVHPHLGVDYAAPTGTPVVAVGSGTVEFTGFHGGSGRMVRLRHSGNIETLYLHLSRVAVRSGARVAQGDVIGYVGSTGLATGPHLDFRIVQRGKYVNPTRMIFPPAPPVSKSSLPTFIALRDELKIQLQKASL